MTTAASRVRAARESSTSADAASGRMRSAARLATSAASTGAAVEAEPPGVEPGQVEQVLDEALEAAGLGADDVDRPGHVVGGPLGERRRRSRGWR